MARELHVDGLGTDPKARRIVKPLTRLRLHQIQSVPIRSLQVQKVHVARMVLFVLSLHHLVLQLLENVTVCSLQPVDFT